MDFELLKRLQQTKTSKLPAFLSETYNVYDLEINNQEFEILIPSSKGELFEQWISNTDNLSKPKLKKLTHLLNGIFKKYNLESF